MSSMSTEPERDQHKASWLTVVRGRPYLPAGTLVVTTVRYVLDAINVLRPGPACGAVRRSSSGAQRWSVGPCSRPRLVFGGSCHEALPIPGPRPRSHERP
jgi:hypothetical protein